MELRPYGNSENCGSEALQYGNGEMLLATVSNEAREPQAVGVGRDDDQSRSLAVPLHLRVSVLALCPSLQPVVRRSGGRASTVTPSHRPHHPRSLSPMQSLFVTLLLLATAQANLNRSHLRVKRLGHPSNHAVPRTAHSERFARQVDHNGDILGALGHFISA